MKKITMLIFTVSFLSFAQYNHERTTEQSFENSDLFFKSHYLNTFGLFRFKQISAGLIDDPFLNLYINPANLPNLNDDALLIYVDFRGDRTTADLFDGTVVPTYYDRGLSIMYPYPDPRWLTVARAEPEPIISIGLLANPLSHLTKNFFIGGSYQLIHKQEKFYQMPYWIYYPNFYYDALGVSREGLKNVPIIDRFAGKDEMTNEAHLFTFYMGYKLMNKLSLGASVNGVSHLRDGSYFNTYRDEYNAANDPEYTNSQLLERNQNYDHIDFSLGAVYELSDKSLVGLKGGILNGKADQDYSSQSVNYYKKNKPEESADWWLNDSKFSTIQKWQHDGTSKYIGFNFMNELKKGKELSGFYRFTASNEDVSNSSTIFDTSYYSSRWSWDASWSYYRGSSVTSDKRTGTGFRKKYNHEVLLSFKSDLTASIRVIVGLYYNNLKTEYSVTEPAQVLRISDYLYTSSNWPQNSYFLKLTEDKILEWNYNSRIWSVQIPVILDFTLSKYFSLMFGINRILTGSVIDEETTAFFKKRERIENSSTETETNFGERYLNPTKKFSEKYFDLISSLDVKISDAFKIKLLLDPEIEPQVRVAQWWMSFEMKL